MAVAITNNKAHEQRGGGGKRDLEEHLVQIPHFTNEGTDKWRDEGRF